MLFNFGNVHEMEDTKIIEKRKSIWNVISEFYLDTELQKSDYDRIFKIFNAFDFDITELKTIDLYEVFPVVKGNLLSTAGIWGGFDEKYLNEACEKAFFRRRNLFFRLKIKFYNHFLYHERKNHWIKIENRIKLHCNKNPSKKP